MLILLIADFVEDEELRLRPIVCGIRDPGLLRIFRRLLGDTSRVTVVFLARERVDNVG